MDRSSTARTQHSLYRRNEGRTQKGNQLEQVRLIQFVVCLALALTLLIGKGVFPDKMAELRTDMMAFMSRDLDVRGALSRLGDSLSDSQSSLGDLGTFCAEVFGPQTKKKPVSYTDCPAFETQLIHRRPLPPGSLSEQLPELWTKNQTPPETDEKPQKVPPAPNPEVSPEHIPETPPEPSEQAEPASVPAVGTVLMKAEYTGKELPARYTMDHISLGALETVNPVEGRMTSSYGYRVHPITGLYVFHGGTDIGCPMGTPIGAFASGTVDYIGEDDAFGKYLQLDHGNGVKSFYAHCSKVCVDKGQTVQIGETVAEVGSTGRSTGPHLHLELKYNGMHLNPAYYVTFAEKP